MNVKSLGQIDNLGWCNNNIGGFHAFKINQVLGRLLFYVKDLI